MFACAQAYVRFLRVLVWVHVLVLVGSSVNDIFRDSA